MGKFFVNKFDGRLHRGVAFAPVVCGNCCYLTEAVGEEFIQTYTGHLYCYWLGADDRATAGRGCHAVNRSGRAKFEAVEEPPQANRIMAAYKSKGD